METENPTLGNTPPSVRDIQNPSLAQKPITKPKRRLSKKQKGFVKDYIETGIGVRAALNNYDTTDYDTAHAIATENLQKPSIQNAIAEALPDDLLAKRHLELLNKRDSIVVSKEDGTKELIDKGPETQAVSKALDMAYNLKGSYAPEKRINLDIDLPSSKERTLAEEFEKRLRENL